MQQRLRVDGDIFENAPRVDAYIFYTDKKMRFRKYPDTCGRGLNVLLCSIYREAHLSILNSIQSSLWEIAIKFQQRVNHRLKSSVGLCFSYKTCICLTSGSKR